MSSSSESVATVTARATAAATRSMIYLGMDVHKEAITIAVLPAGAKTPTRLDRLANDLPKLKRWLDRIARDGGGAELGICYEASGAGYVLHRAIEEWGHACEVIAPSLILKRPSVQRKHDKRTLPTLLGFIELASSPWCESRVRVTSKCATSCDAAKHFSTRFSSHVTTSASSWRDADSYSAKVQTGVHRISNGFSI